MLGRIYFRVEANFKYFVIIKLSNFHWKDTVPVAVFFSCEIKQKCLQS